MLVKGIPDKSLNGKTKTTTPRNPALVRTVIPNSARIRVGQIVNIHRPDMCRKDATHRDNIYPHIVLEVRLNKFVAVPFSSSYDSFSEKVTSEIISKKWGNRSRDGWIAANRVKSYRLDTPDIADFWGFIPAEAPVWAIIWKVLRRYNNYLSVTGRRTPPFVPYEQRGQTVATSSYEKFSV